MSSEDSSLAYYGIEQEVALLRDFGHSFVDYTNTRPEELQEIIEQLPRFETDYQYLRVGDLGLKQKRWYVEGYERFHPDGTLRISVPKSFEIRTTPRPTPEAALKELRRSYQLLAEACISRGFMPTWISYNPVHDTFVLDRPLNAYERSLRSHSPEDQTAKIVQLTYGPDLNLSFPQLTDDALILAGKKLTYWSPYIIPFSFSSPFQNSTLWHGLSYRTYMRTGARPAALVFVHDTRNHRQTTPSLTQPSRVPFERGRIEFKAFDTCHDLRLYCSLFYLLKGIILNPDDCQQRTAPDTALHQRSAVHGYANPEIAAGARAALTYARQGLSDSAERAALDDLLEILRTNNTPVHSLIRMYKKNKSVLDTLGHFQNIH